MLLALVGVKSYKAPVLRPRENYNVKSLVASLVGLNPIELFLIDPNTLWARFMP